MTRSSRILVLFIGAFLPGILLSDVASQDDVDRDIQAATALLDQGRTAESKKMFEILLAQLQGKKPSSQLGLVLNSLSKISAAGGDYKAAEQFAKQSANAYHYVGDSSGESHSLNNEGIAEMQLGHYLSAQKALEAALVLSRRAQDGENQVQTLNNLGSAYYFPGSYSEAMLRYDEAMTLVNQNHSSKWAAYWRKITSFNQATLDQRLGRYEKALQIYREVEQSSENLTPGDRAHLYANLGALYRRLGDPYKALDTYRVSQRLYSEQHDVGGELTVLKNIGIVYALDMEDLRQAERIFRSAIVLAERTNNRREEMQAHLYLGETLFHAGHSSEAKAEFESSQSISTELATAEEHWKSLYGLGRIAEQEGRASTAEELYRQAISIIEKTRSQLQLSSLRSEFFADKREAYDALIALLFAKQDIIGVFSFLERSRSRNFQDRLNGPGEDSRKSPELEHACAAVGPSTTLLEYWTSGNRAGLVWCTSSKSGLMLKTLSFAEANQVHELLGGMPNNLGTNWREQFRVLSGLLPDDPEALRGIQHLIIVPDGWISYLPFDLMAAPLRSSAALIEEYDITYLPTAAVLHRSHSYDKRLLFPWNEELVAFGDPTSPVGDSLGTPDEDMQGTGRLRFSGQEISDIARLTSGRSNVFVQQNDLRRSFLGPVLSRALVLHVSTHAFADAESPENSRLLFSPESASGDPEYVFLREIYDLDLSRVRLATISACDTERGRIIRGEGIQAFSRALLSAGAASSLTTFWRVDDEQTSEFMKQFYFLALRKHLPKARALQQTKLDFLRSNSRLSNPALWAAFVLNGDGANPLPSVLSWSELSLLSLGTVSVLVFTVWIGLRSRSRINRKQDFRAVVS